VSRENVDLYIHSPIRLHGVVLNYLSTGTTLPFFTFNGCQEKKLTEKLYRNRVFSKHFIRRFLNKIHCLHWKRRKVLKEILENRQMLLRTTKKKGTGMLQGGEPCYKCNNARNTNSPAVESPSVSYTGKVSNSKKNTTRTKRKMMHDVLFLGINCLCSIERIHT
jgi:hypothetical protein